MTRQSDPASAQRDQRDLLTLQRLLRAGQHESAGQTGVYRRVDHDHPALRHVVYDTHDARYGLNVTPDGPALVNVARAGTGTGHPDLQQALRSARAFAQLLPASRHPTLDPAVQYRQWRREDLLRGLHAARSKHVQLTRTEPLPPAVRTQAAHDPSLGALLAAVVTIPLLFTVPLPAGMALLLMLSMLVQAVRGAFRHTSGKGVKAMKYASYGVLGTLALIMTAGGVSPTLFVGALALQSLARRLMELRFGPGGSAAPLVSIACLTALLALCVVETGTALLISTGLLALAAPFAHRAQDALTTAAQGALATAALARPEPTPTPALPATVSLGETLTNHERFLIHQTHETLELALRENERLQDTRRTFEARTALTQTLPETVQAYEHLHPDDRDPAVFSRVLEQLTLPSRPDRTSDRQRWDTQVRYVTGKAGTSTHPERALHIDPEDTP